MPAIITGLWVQEKRRQFGLSQEELAQLLNISAKTVWRWEHDKNRPIRALHDRLVHFFETFSNNLQVFNGAQQIEGCRLLLQLGDGLFDGPEDLATRSDDYRYGKPQA